MITASGKIAKLCQGKWDVVAASWRADGGEGKADLEVPKLPVMCPIQNLVPKARAPLGWIDDGWTYKVSLASHWSGSLIPTVATSHFKACF